MRTKKILLVTTAIIFLLITHQRAAAQFFGVKVNALAALTGTVCVGAEAALTDNWTVELSGYWNPIRTNRFTTQLYAAQLGVRCWFFEDFVGHFLGVHTTYIDYRIGNRHRTYDGQAYGVGLSYGYAWIISKRWNIVVEAGVGLYRTRDTRRTPIVDDWGDRYIWHARRWTLAPSKLEVSFNYLF